MMRDLPTGLLLATCILTACGSDEPDPAPEPGSWSFVAPMPTARTFAGAGVVNGIVYVVGGYSPGIVLATLEAYDPGTNTWTAKASMPGPRGGVAVGVVNGILYVFGGADLTGYLGTVQAYDPATDSWSTKSSMPTPRFGAGVGVVDGIIYVVGGDTASAPPTHGTAMVEAYNPSTDSWVSKAPMSIPRIAPGIAALNGVIYAVGGDTVSSAGSGVVDRVETYDPAANRWTIRTPLDVARGGIGVAELDGTLYAVGGYADRDAVGTVEAYNPATGAWVPRAPMQAKWGFTVSATTGVLYAIGGQDTVSNAVATVQAFRP